MAEPSEAPLARKKAVQRRIFTGAGLPYAYRDGNSTVRATNADRAPPLSCLLSVSIVRLLSIVRSGKVGRVVDPSEPFLSFIVVVRAGLRPARLQNTLASQCSHGVGRRAAKCRRGRGLDISRRPARLEAAGSITIVQLDNGIRGGSSHELKAARRRQCPRWPIWPPRPTRTSLEVRPPDWALGPAPKS